MKMILKIILRCSHTFSPNIFNDCIIKYMHQVLMHIVKLIKVLKAFLKPH